MSQHNSEKLQITISEIEDLGIPVAKYVQQGKWSLVIEAMHKASFTVGLDDRRRIAITMYKLSKELKHKKGLGLSFFLLGEYLVANENFHLGYQFYLQAYRFSEKTMLAVPIWEALTYFPLKISEDPRADLANHRSDPEGLIQKLVDEYGD